MIASFSLQRMGPSFERSRFALPLGALGLAMMIFIPENKQYFEGGSGICQYHFCDSEIRELYLEFMIDSIIWISLALLGLALVLRGSLYGYSIISVSIVGWFLILASWYQLTQIQLFVSLVYSPIVIFWFIFVSIGIICAFYLYFVIIRYSERRLIGEGQTSPLDEREMKMVTEIIRRNLRGDRQ